MTTPPPPVFRKGPGPKAKVGKARPPDWQKVAAFYLALYSSGKIRWPSAREAGRIAKIDTRQVTRYLPHLLERGLISKPRLGKGKRIGFTLNQPPEGVTTDPLLHDISHSVWQVGVTDDPGFDLYLSHVAATLAHVTDGSMQSSAHVLRNDEEEQVSAAKQSSSFQASAHWGDGPPPPAPEVDLFSHSKSAAEVAASRGGWATASEVQIIDGLRSQPGLDVGQRLLREPHLDKDSAIKLLVKTKVPFPPRSPDKPETNTEMWNRKRAERLAREAQPKEGVSL